MRKQKQINKWQPIHYDLVYVGLKVGGGHFFLSLSLLFLYYGYIVYHHYFGHTVFLYKQRGC